MEISRLPWTFKSFQECKQTFLLDFLTVPKRQADLLPFLPFQGNNQTPFLSDRSHETSKCPSFSTVPRRQSNLLPFLPFQEYKQTSFLSYPSNETCRLPFFLTVSTRLRDFLTVPRRQADSLTAPQQPKKLGMSRNVPADSSIQYTRYTL